jgi:hypothetical protein
MCAQASRQPGSTARHSHYTQLHRSESLCDALRKELFSWHFSHPFRGRNPTSAVQISLLRTDLGLDLDAIACLQARDVSAAALAAELHRFAREKRNKPPKKRVFYTVKTD